MKVFLNQAHAGLWLAQAWFLKIGAMRIFGMRVRMCVSVPETTNNYSGKMWYDMNPKRLVKQVIQQLHDNYSHYR